MGCHAPLRTAGASWDSLLSRRALRSQSSMPRDGALSREGSRAGTAAASPEEGGAPQGSGQAWARVCARQRSCAERYSGGSLGPRRRTRSNAQEHSPEADTSLHVIPQADALLLHTFSIHLSWQLKWSCQTQSSASQQSFCQAMLDTDQLLVSRAGESLAMRAKPQAAGHLLSTAKAELLIRYKITF